MNLYMRGGAAAALLSALLVYGTPPSAASGLPVPDAGVAGASVSGTSVSGTLILEAADHAELAADVSASGVVRIALPGDRVARVIRAPGGLRVEHDPASGDLYLHPVEDDEAAAGPAALGAVETGAAPAVLFIGTERGFTYRLALQPAPAGASQILIRNPAVVAPVSASASAPDRAAGAGDERIGALVRLILAVARGEPPAGHAIHAGGAVAGMSVAGTSVAGTSVSGLTFIETWRGPRFAALVFEAGPSAPWGAEGAAGLAGTLVPETIGALSDVGRIAALWLAGPGTGPSGDRLAVAVHEYARAGDTSAGDVPAADVRQAGGSR